MLKLDDVALREIFRNVDVESQINCRMACKAWNDEIMRMNRITQKYPSSSLIIMCESSSLNLSNTCNKINSEVREEDVTFSTIRRLFWNLAPSDVLNITLDWDCTQHVFQTMISSMDSWWRHKIKDLELVTYTNIKMPIIIEGLSKFKNLSHLSFSHYCNETLSLAELFRVVPHLQFIRLFAFNSNDGSAESSGLVFDDETIDVLIMNQKKNMNRIHCMEVYNTDVLCTKEKLAEFLVETSRIPLKRTTGKGFKISCKNEEDSDAFNLLFDCCNWETIKQSDVVSICNIVGTDCQPWTGHNESFHQDFRCKINNIEFILNFMAGSKHNLN